MHEGNVSIPPLAICFPLCTWGWDVSLTLVHWSLKGLPSRVFSVEGDDAPGSGLGALDEEDDLVDLSYVYLRRDICWWCVELVP